MIGKLILVQLKWKKTCQSHPNFSTLAGLMETTTRCICKSLVLKLNYLWRKKLSFLFFFFSWNSALLRSSYLVSLSAYSGASSCVPLVDLYSTLWLHLESGVTKLRCFERWIVKELGIRLELIVWLELELARGARVGIERDSFQSFDGISYSGIGDGISHSRIGCFLGSLKGDFARFQESSLLVLLIFGCLEKLSKNYLNSWANSSRDGAYEYFLYKVSHWAPAVLH